jgi:sialate O-acetylesterase
MVLQHGQVTNLWGRARPNELIQVSFHGAIYTATAGGGGRWETELPALPPSLTPFTINISAAGGEVVTLTDVLFGNVFVCSGQSNMGLTVSATVNASAEIAAAGTHGPGIRILQVALEQDYCNVTAPAENFTADIPWARPATSNAKANADQLTSSPANFSAQCYYFGIELTKVHPTIPVGLIATSWGGTAIEVWMSNSSLHTCLDANWSTADLHEHVKHLTARTPDRGLGYLTRQAPPRLGLGGCGIPQVPSTLFNAMISPLLVLKIAGIVW